MLRRLDHVLRFAYVLLAPAMIAALAGLIPVTGLSINAGLATVIALAGSDRWVARTQGIPVIGRPLSKIGRLGEYYREHPPKPLLYYVLYPLFAPYWLFKKSARQELFVYKRLGALAVIITLVTAAVDFAKNWQPLPFKYFAGSMLGTMFVQLIVTFMFVMPIVTTVIEFHRHGHKKSLVFLAVVGLALGVVTVVGLRSVERIPFATQQRALSRIKWKPDVAREVMARALAAPTQEDARGVLAEFFRRDEARAFKRTQTGDVVVLWAKLRQKKHPWIARSRNGAITRFDGLPVEVREVLKLSPEAAPFP